MPNKKAETIWFNGRYVPWDEAQIHVLAHVVNYGSSVFEGIRAYATEKGPAVFRLEPHVRRLFDSAKVYCMDIPYSQEEISEVICETIRINRLPSAYIRPLVFRGYAELGVNPFNCPVEVVVATFEWGRYLGPEALEEGETGILRVRPTRPPDMPSPGFPGRKKTSPLN